jgi:hypothetical protein
VVVKYSDTVVANVAVRCPQGPEDHATLTEFKPTELLLLDVEVVDPLGFGVDRHVFLMNSVGFVCKVI